MTDLELILTKAAVIAGAGFFLWKVAAGWLVVNVEISIETDRQSETDDKDLLAFKINLKKGNTDTLQIKDIQARVRTEDESLPAIEIFSFAEIHKLNAKNVIVDWNSPHKKDERNISLSPTESFHLGRFVRVPKDVPVIVEAVLHGTRTLWWKGFQWRTSVASLPVKKK